MYVNVTAKAKAAINGLSNDIPATVTTLPVNGQVIAVKQTLATLTAFVNLAEAVAPAKVTYRQAVAAVAAQVPQIRELLSNLETALRAVLGKGNPVLASFGFRPAHAGKATAEVKAAAVQKRKALREAKKQLASSAAATAPAGGTPANGR